MIGSIRQGARSDRSDRRGGGRWPSASAPQRNPALVVAELTEKSIGVHQPRLRRSPSGGPTAFGAWVAQDCAGIARCLQSAGSRAKPSMILGDVLSLQDLLGAQERRRGPHISWITEAVRTASADCSPLPRTYASTNELPVKPPNTHSLQIRRHPIAAAKPNMTLTGRR